MKRKFLIPSLLAAGLFPENALSNVPLNVDPGTDEDREPTLFERFKLDHKYNLAGHRSHRSHGSHSSHRSSSGGSYSVPRTSPTPRIYTTPKVPAPGIYQAPNTNRNLNSTPPTSILPSPPAAAPQPNLNGSLARLPGNAEKFKRIVREVQTALIVYGYYTGAVDGLVGPQTRAAISKLQSDYGLKVTGTITPEVLNALYIVAR